MDFCYIERRHSGGQETQAAMSGLTCWDSQSARLEKGGNLNRAGSARQTKSHPAHEQQAEKEICGLDAR